MKRISDLKVPELHDELTKRGLAKKGKKQELIQVSFFVHFRVTLKHISGCCRRQEQGREHLYVIHLFHRSLDKSNQ